MNHPNAVAGGSSGLGAALVVYLISLAGYEIPGWVGAAAAAAAASVFLFVGRNGVRGVIRLVWRGSG